MAPEMLVRVIAGVLLAVVIVILVLRRKKGTQKTDEDEF
jgi:hypothetical protein